MFSKQTLGAFCSIRTSNVANAMGLVLGLLFIGLYPQVSMGDREMKLGISVEEVGRYEKIEFLIHLDTVYGNPFDPDEVDLSIQIKTPGGDSITIPAFYYQHYERQYMDKGEKKTDWLYPVGDPVWKARFAPDEVGRYSCIAKLKDRKGNVRSNTASFQCMPSQSKGFVRVSEKEPRFLEFSEGLPFFPVGQNLAFVGQTQHVDLGKMERIFREMSQNGANFARIWTCCSDWAMAIEARKSAWSRSWNWNPPIVPIPGHDGYLFDQKCISISGEGGTSVSASPCHPVALRPDTRYVASGRFRKSGETELLLEINNVRIGEITSKNQERRWVEWEREFTTTGDQRWLNSVSFSLTGKGTVWLDGLSLKGAGGGPELLWEAEVNRPIMGYYNPVDCFMLDEVLKSAEENGVYLQLCLMTRDLYMGSLSDEGSPEYYKAIQHGKKLLRYVVARWGYSTSVAVWEYFNEMNPDLPTDQFYSEMSDYLEQIDPYKHLRATSAWAPCEKDWRNPKLDIADLHWYLRPAWGEIWKDEVAGVMNRARLLREHTSGKPALLSEFGLADDRWGLSPYMKQDEELSHFHNVLWASALSGVSGTALFWWWKRLDVMGAYTHYHALSSFLADIPFTETKLRQTSAAASHQQVRAVGLQGDECAHIWLFNTQAIWYNLVVDKVKPDEIKHAKLEIRGLIPGTYRIQWWHTQKGEIIRQEDISLSEKSLQVLIPDFARDIACKIVKQ